MERPDPIRLLDWPRPASPRTSQTTRLWPRATAAFSVRVPGRVTWEGINLSCGGMLCRAPQPWWPGNEVDVELVLRGQPPIEVHGRVIELLDYQGEIAMRVCFSPLAAEQCSLIRQWVALH